MVCYFEVVVLIVESPRGEIEMDILNPVDSFYFMQCDFYFIMEIFNVEIQMGSYSIRLETILPTGLKIVSDSSELAYPNETGYFTVNA